MTMKSKKKATMIEHGRDIVVRDMLDRLDKDPDHHKKIVAAQARYSTVDEAN